MYFTLKYKRTSNDKTSFNAVILVKYASGSTQLPLTAVLTYFMGRVGGIPCRGVETKQLSPGRQVLDITTRTTVDPWHDLFQDRPRKIWSLVSGYHADTPITIKAEASSKANSRPN